MMDTILVPFEFPDPEPLSPVLVENLSSLDVVVLGHYGVPEQTPREMASEQFGDDAQATLDDVVAIGERHDVCRLGPVVALVVGEGRVGAPDLGLDEFLVLDLDVEFRQRPGAIPEVFGVLADGDHLEIPAAGHQHPDVDDAGDGLGRQREPFPFGRRNCTHVHRHQSPARAFENRPSQCTPG